MSSRRYTDDEGAAYHSKFDDVDPPHAQVCSICKRALNQPGDLTTQDCGGDCLRCVAEAGDPECLAAMKGRWG